MSMKLSIVSDLRLHNRVYLKTYVLKSVLALMVVFIGQGLSASDYYVSDSLELINALKAVGPGDEIILAPGVYSNNTTSGPKGSSAYFSSDIDGDTGMPITIRSEDPEDMAIIKGSDRDWLCLLRIMGDYWVVKDLKFTHGNKGLIFDNSNHSVALNCEFWNIGEEAVHIRDGSDYTILDGLKIWDVGNEDPRIGEGIYIGNSKAQWPDYDPYCDYTIIRNCVIGPDCQAEPIDIKEGTRGTVVENCTLNVKGISGENSADSHIDIKGSDVVVRFNTFISNVTDNNFVEAIAVYHRGDNYEPTGTHIVIHDNTFDYGSDTEKRMVFKVGKAKEVYAFNNERIPAPSSLDNIYANGIIESCPSWYNGCGPYYELKGSASDGFVNPKGGTFISGQEVLLYATPHKGYEFNGWTGDLSGADNPLTLTMNGNKEITANFKLANKEKYTLIVNAENGSVKPNGGDYYDGAAIVLGAYPEPGYKFKNWSGDLNGTDNPVTIIMDKDKTITANIEKLDAELITVCSVSSSAEDGDNKDDNVLDNDLQTRWSAFGKGQWFQLDLCGPYVVNLVRIGFYKGDQRTTSFDLEVSENGSSWTKVSSELSSGAGNALEGFVLDDVLCRYIRYVGQGNSSNDWNSVTDIEVYTNSDNQNRPVSGVALEEENLIMKVGGEAGLTANILPANASNKSLEWWSTDTRVAIVDGSGNVTAKEIGEAYVIVKTEDGGFEDTCKVSVEESPVTITASFTATPTSGYAPLTVNFDASASGISNGAELEYTWDFGDDSTGKGMSVSHKYATPDNYTVGLTVSNSNYGSDRVDVTINVYDPEIKTNLALKFLDNGTEDDRTQFSVKIYNEGDRTVDYSDLKVRYWFTNDEVDKNLSFSCYYAAIGKTNVKADFVPMQVEAQNADTYLELSFNPGAGILAVGENSGTIKIAFHYSDRSQSLLFNNDYSYNGTMTSYGNYERVTLYEKSKLVYGKEPSGDLVNRPPVAEFTTSPTNGQAPLTVHFDAAGAYDPDNHQLSYTWDFGDNTTATGIGASHNYSSPGTYEAKLTVSDGELSDSKTIIIKINSTPIEPVTVIVDTKAINLTVDKSFTLHALVNPDNATNKSIFWSTSNETIAIVNENGVVVGVAEGIATIKATTHNGLSDSCVVSVIPKDTGGCGFDIPRATALPPLDEAYKEVYVLGAAPDMSFFRKLSVNWGGTKGQLWVFAFNLDHSPWYINLRSNQVNNFHQANPSIEITGSGITGIDGGYYINSVDNMFIMKEIEGAFTLVFSNSTEKPCNTAVKYAQSMRGIDEQEKNDFFIYPNPAHSVLNIKADVVGETSIAIYTVSGILVRNLILNSSLIELDVSGFDKGLYVLELSNSVGLQTRKFVVE